MPDRNAWYGSQVQVQVKLLLQGTSPTATESEWLWS